MDALEFLKERKRMCSCYKHCLDCPLGDINCALNAVDSDEKNEQVIAAVEQWSKEHPRKTRQSVFLEQWPEARIADSGVLNICPANVSAKHRDQRACLARPCGICCREFWMQEVDNLER